MPEIYWETNNPNRTKKVVGRFKSASIMQESCGCHSNENALQFLIQSASSWSFHIMLLLINFTCSRPKNEVNSLLDPISICFRRRWSSFISCTFSRLLPKASLANKKRWDRGLFVSWSSSFTHYHTPLAQFHRFATRRTTRSVHGRTSKLKKRRSMII